MSNFRRRLMMSFEKKYTPVEYLESTRTQYIDVQFIPNQDTKVEIDGMFTVPDGTSLFGSNPHYVITSRSSGNYLFRYNNINYETQLKVLNRKIIKIDKTGVYINGSLYINWEEQTFQSTYSALIFARRNSSGGVEEKSSSRIYSCKIWDNDTLVRDFVPVIDSSGIPCLYDKVEDKFYYNEGSGEFLYE